MKSSNNRLQRTTLRAAAEPERWVACLGAPGGFISEETCGIPCALLP